ncbi:uncharacterized protein LOC127494800 [Ctenopharyngodon idella]|uniref:uncharacterized protein LOC127494800 n=1 Tax=Ctenopharyngodon idella TaxID=7959 RepID=UPI002232B3B4|nr:uncharacterized protein LOC127494800 [Ctenopharyngodon idella]
MPDIIPRHKIKGVDFCGSSFYYYIIRSDLGCYMRSCDFRGGGDLRIYALHPACQNGDHYFADEIGQFYIIKGNSYRKVMDLSTDTESAVYTLHPNCQGGDHYLSAFDWFYIIFQEKGTYRRTKDLSQDSGSDEFALHPNCRNGLYYWGLPDHYYFLKPASEWGVEYYIGNDFEDDRCVAVYSVHPDVLNFLPGGLSITNGPAFRKWDNIQTVSNDSPTPVTWQKKVTKKVGYNTEKTSQITQNWKIETSGSITAGKLARLILKWQFSFSTEYGGSSANAEKESLNEETEVEEQLSFELKPNQRFNLWQYQLGLGSEPVLFCQDLKITDQPNPPPEVPLPHV